MNYFDTNNCGKSFHVFARDSTEDEAIQAYHPDGDYYELCKGAEFNITELLEDDLPHMYRCPWCDRVTLNDDDHIRRCSGFQKPLSRDEVLDAYSHPADAAKREAMLRDYERGE
jgi:hypothetical protein